MKMLVAALFGAILILLAVLFWQTEYHRRMLRHLQLCICWNDRFHLSFPTQHAFRKGKEKETAA